MPALQPTAIVIKEEEWKDAKGPLLRVLNYLIKDVYEWIGAIQGIDNKDVSSLVIHDHQSDAAGGGYSWADIIAADVAYIQALRAATPIYTDLATDAEITAAVSTHAGLPDPHTVYQKESDKDSASGYAGLNASSRTTKGVLTTDDVIVDLATKGLVLKDTQGTPHYWRVTVETDGTLTTSDLGVSLP